MLAEQANAASWQRLQASRGHPVHLPTLVLFLPYWSSSLLYLGDPSRRHHRNVSLCMNIAWAHMIDAAIATTRQPIDKIANSLWICVDGFHFNTLSLLHNRIYHLREERRKSYFTYICQCLPTIPYFMIQLWNRTQSQDAVWSSLKFQWYSLIHKNAIRCLLRALCNCYDTNENIYGTTMKSLYNFYENHMKYVWQFSVAYMIILWILVWRFFEYGIVVLFFTWVYNNAMRSLLSCHANSLNVPWEVYEMCVQQTRWIVYEDYIGLRLIIWQFMANSVRCEI